MEYFANHGFIGNRLMQLNRCRLFLQICSLADIVEGSGETITILAWNGIRDTTHQSSYT